MKHFKALSLCLMAALGLMAFLASGAQAEWLLEGKVITENTPFHGVIHPLEKEPKTKHLVLLVPAKEIEILCAKLVIDEGVLLSGASLAALGLLLFSECETFQKKVLSKGCKPKEPIDAKVIGKLILHEKLNYILIEPDLTKNFTVIDFNEETCALPDTEVNGSVVVECMGEKLELKEVTGIDYCLEELVHHLITEASRKLFPADVLKYGANEAFLDGIVDLLLSGKDEGKKWSGHV